MLRELANRLTQCCTTEEKIGLLTPLPHVSRFLERQPRLSSFIEKSTPEERLVIHAAVAAGQGERLFSDFSEENTLKLLKKLLSVERFYSSLGGIVGYQARMLELLQGKSDQKEGLTAYHAPEGINIAEENEQVRKAIIDGIATMPQMAEIYPLGGAADRLRLYDEKTGVPLPAARLPFLGKSLLEGLIADLQSREYLHYKIFGKQITTPVAVMTSEEKNNHRHIQEICEEMNWFGRPKESFRFFCQPMVPTINREGAWCLQGEQELLLRPGGHGVIWRLAESEEIFDWLFSLGRKKALVRQVNNPVANTDHGIIAFTGIGCAQDKRFGFASCPRQVKASEGVNVLIEASSNDAFRYTLTNIEYCDFKKFGIVDEPEKPGSPYSKFPSNTNILFVDLQGVLEASRRCPIPGILVNLKKLNYRMKNGEKKEEEVARLESTMQNIADFFDETFDKPLPSGKRHQLKTYLTYNHRRKTISAAKREFTLGSNLLETPEGCFLDILKNNRDLLMHGCHLQTPPVSDPLHFFEKGPSFIFLYHPALGPLYSVIAQKIRGGRLHQGSELQLDIAEADIENLDLQGSLLIQAESVMGHIYRNNLKNRFLAASDLPQNFHSHSCLASRQWSLAPNENSGDPPCQIPDSSSCFGIDAGRLNYSEACGRVVLKNVTIRNKGIDLEMPNVYWRNEIARQEVCQIILRGMSEFYAEDVTLHSDHFIEVPNGKRCFAQEIKGEVQFIFEKIDSPSWHWEYKVDTSNEIILQKKR